MAPQELMMLWAADPQQPHSQYILEVGTPLIRYRPFQFRTYQALLDFTAERQPLQDLLIPIPGYYILLVVERLWEHSNEWAPVRPGSFVYGQLHDQLQHDPRPATFYITHKIQPNAAKFNRYRAD